MKMLQSNFIAQSDETICSFPPDIQINLNNARKRKDLGTFAEIYGLRAHLILLRGR